MSATIDPPGFDRLMQVRRFSALVSGWKVTPVWHPDGDRVAYLDPATGGLVLADARTGTRAPLVDVDAARKAVQDALGADLGLAFPPAVFRFSDAGSTIAFELDGRIIRLGVADPAAPSVEVLPTAATLAIARRKPQVTVKALIEGHPDLYEVPSPDGRWALSQTGLDDHDLWLRATVDDRRHRLTDDGTKDVHWSAVGAVWSTDALRLCALRVDDRGRATIPVVHWLAPVEQVSTFPYTKSGGRPPRLDLFVIDPLSHDRVHVDTGTRRGDWIVPLRFVSGGAEIVYVTVSRNAQDVLLRAADTTTGISRTIIHEHQDTFVVNIPPALWAAQLSTFVGEDEVIWLTERSGHQHLHRYGLDGSDRGALTAGDWVVQRVAGIDQTPGARRAWIVAQTDADRPYDKHVALVDLDRPTPADVGDLDVLTTEPGVHAPAVAPSGRFAIDTHSSVSRPPSVDVLRPGSVAQVRPSSDVLSLAKADTTRLHELGWTPPTEFTALADDRETELWGVLYHPPGFDEARRYPLIEFIYGGPQGTLHPQDFLQSRAEVANELAQLGFVTMVVDGRGTPERSKAFIDHVHGRFGQTQIPEHAGVVRQLLDRHAWLDPERVGITGRSWGGYMTLRAMVTAPDVYKVGAMMYGVGDLWDHNNAAIEPYMGLPKDNPAGYNAADSLAIIDRLDGPLLIGHGTSDLNATFSATMKIVDALARANKMYELVVLPEGGHTTDGIHGDYWYRRLAEFFVRHLRPDDTPIIAG